MVWHFKSLLTTSIIAFKKWLSRDPFRESAVIAYYSIFSLPGMLVVIVTSAGFFLGREAVNDRLAVQITDTLGAQSAEFIQKIIAHASQSKNSIWAAAIAVVTILVGATGVFAEFQTLLNAIWEVKKDKSKSSLLHLLRVRLFSFGLILSIAFILIVSLIVSAVLSILGHWLSNHFSGSFSITLQVANFAASLAILAGLFALMFKFLPDARVQWRHVWVGSLVTAFLFNIGKLALGLYFGTANPGTGYGAAGSVILIMLWVSYSSMIVSYGAEFTHAYAAMHSEKPLPSEIAGAAIPLRAMVMT